MKSETPKNLDPISQKPKKRPGEIIPEKSDDVAIMQSPFMEEKSKKPEKKLAFDEKNPLNVKIGDKITIKHEGKIEEGWKILDIDPKTGKMKLYKDEKFTGADVNDPLLYGLNVLRSEEPSKPVEHKSSPEKYAKIMRQPEELKQTQTAMEAIPFKIGQEVKVKRRFGPKESGWQVLSYDSETGRVQVMKGRTTKKVKLDKLIEWNK